VRDCDYEACSIVADANGPYGGLVAQPVYLYGSATGGQGSGPYTYEYAWDLDDDGLFDDSTMQNPIVGWEIEGDFPVCVRVNDASAPYCYDTDCAIVHISEAVECQWTFPHGLTQDPTAVFKRIHGGDGTGSSNGCTADVALPAGTEPADLIIVWFYNESAMEWEWFRVGWTESTLGSLQMGEIYDIIVMDACTWQVVAP